MVESGGLENRCGSRDLPWVRIPTSPFMEMKTIEWLPAENGFAFGGNAAVLKTVRRSKALRGLESFRLRMRG